MGHSSLTAREFILQVPFTHGSGTAPALNIHGTRWLSCLPACLLLLPMPHSQPSTPCFRQYQTRSLPPFKSSAAAHVVTQLNHGGRSWFQAAAAWKCSFLQLPNSHEWLLPTNPVYRLIQQLTDTSAAPSFELWNTLQVFCAWTTWILVVVTSWYILMLFH